MLLVGPRTRTDDSIHGTSCNEPLDMQSHGEFGLSGSTSAGVCARSITTIRCAAGFRVARPEMQTHAPIRSYSSSTRSESLARGFLKRIQQSPAELHAMVPTRDVALILTIATVVTRVVTTRARSVGPFLNFSHFSSETGVLIDENVCFSKKKDDQRPKQIHKLSEYRKHRGEVNYPSPSQSTSINSQRRSLEPRWLWMSSLDTY